MQGERTVKGYKVFKHDWSCRGFRYEVGKSYEMDAEPIICDSGFHFCQKLENCFKHYIFDPQNKVAEVEAYGDVISKDGKSCTNKIKILREIPWGEVLHIVNTGYYNTGRHNIGDYNTGDRNTGNYNTGYRNTGNYNTGNCSTGNYNTGDYNTGYYNVGDYNTGDRNTGHYNTGYRNTGNYNTGHYNTGDHNRGDYNTGDYNCISYSSGCFNTIEEKIIMFNKSSDWTIKDWWASKARMILDGMPKKAVSWIRLSEMTDEEKSDNPDYEVLGGCIKILDESGNVQAWWDNLHDYKKKEILALPNFNADIFEKCTGIKVQDG